MPAPPEHASFLSRVVLAVGVVVLAAAAVVSFALVPGGWLILLAGILFGVLLDGLGRLLAGHLPVSRKAAVGIAAAVLLILLVGAGWLIGPRLVEEGRALGPALGSALESVRAWAARQPWGDAVLARVPAPSEIVSSGGDADLFGRLTGVVSSLLSGLTNVLIITFVGLYVALEPGLYADGLVRLFPLDRRRRTRDVLSAVATALRRWLAGRFASMVVVGVLTGVGLWLVGVPLPLPLGFIAGVLAFIPYIGPALSYVPGVLVALSVSPGTALAAAAVYLAVQLLESYAITPLILQRAVELPPAALLGAQVILGLLFGILGVALAEAVTVIAIVLVQAVYINGRLGDDVHLIGQGHG